ncbi:MAG: hypothetical protein ACE5HT_04835 [Gemmatimonadales bacterium]
MHKIAAITLTGLVLAACGDQPRTTLPNEPDAVTELELAANLASEVMRATEADGGPESLVRHLIQGVRAKGDDQAHRMLRIAATLRDSARVALEAGDRQAARRFEHMSYGMVLGAIVRTFPNSPARVGNIVDNVLGHMRQKLGDREAPRIRKILRHVAGLRGRANEALDAGRNNVALGTNLTALRILQRLVHHVKDGLDDAEDDAQATFGNLSR